MDLSIHECFLTPNLAVAKWGFSPEEALNALTKIHATAALFGKTPKSVLAGWANEADPIVEKAYSDFNEEHGTDVKYVPTK